MDDFIYVGQFECLELKRSCNTKKIENHILWNY